MSGRIDRIDSAKTDNKKQAIIFDYKTKGQSFNWQQFFYGLDIQLPLYMLAVGNTKGNQISGIEAVGGFYLPVEADVQPGSYIEDRQKEVFSYKAKGIFNGEYYKMLDGRIEQKWSRYYKFFVSKDNQQYGNYETTSDSLKAEDFENVMDFAANKIKELAEQILSGDIRVHPYQTSSKVSCSFCEFKPLCRFDWLINDYNYLSSVTKMEVIEKAKDGRKKD